MKREAKIQEKLRKKLKEVQERKSGAGDSTLKRAVGKADAEKFRIAFEARHIIEGYFSDRDPEGSNWNGAVVVNGVRCRLRLKVPGWSLTNSGMVPRW